MTAPRLTRRLVLEEARLAPDGAGGHAQVWTALGALWAEVRAGAGRERAAEAAVLSGVAFRITVRAAPPGAPSRPRPDQRFREGARLFRILSVAEADPRGHFLTCFAHEESTA